MPISGSCNVAIVTLTTFASKYDFFYGQSGRNLEGMWPQRCLCGINPEVWRGIYPRKGMSWTCDHLGPCWDWNIMLQDAGSSGRIFLPLHLNLDCLGSTTLISSEQTGSDIKVYPVTGVTCANLRNMIENLSHLHNKLLPRQNNGFLRSGADCFNYKHNYNSTSFNSFNRTVHDHYKHNNQKICVSSLTCGQSWSVVSFDTQRLVKCLDILQGEDINNNYYSCKVTHNWSSIFTSFCSLQALLVILVSKHIT